MKILDMEELQRMVDYSFGDQSGVLGEVPNAYMKEANPSNHEFFKRVVFSPHKLITLFIDNIRLYRRPIEHSDWQHLRPVSQTDRVWLDQFENEDLLKLCTSFPTHQFVIFTAFEDTPLDKYIWDKIPPNVLSINAANSVVFGDKVRPFPHGLERKMYEGYDHHEILTSMLDDTTKASKSLLVCHRADTGSRRGLNEMFSGWATVESNLPYRGYLDAIKAHRFVLCPSGNGIESARNWETLYMRRVPIFKRHPYLEEMFKDFPVLFVGDFSEVTEELLKNSVHLYQQALKMDMEKLDLDYWFKKATI